MSEIAELRRSNLEAIATAPLEHLERMAGQLRAEDPDEAPLLAAVEARRAADRAAEVPTGPAPDLPGPIDPSAFFAEHLASVPQHETSAAAAARVVAEADLVLVPRAVLHEIDRTFHEMPYAAGLGSGGWTVAKDARHAVQKLRGLVKILHKVGNDHRAIESERDRLRSDVAAVRRIFGGES